MRHDFVAPHAGAWIEISKAAPPGSDPPVSLPMRERGLKLAIRPMLCVTTAVAPHAGAWIEIYLMQSREIDTIVAPHAGAWIEIKPFDCGIVRIAGRSPCGSVD